MIRVNNINISFDKPVLSDSSIVIPEGKIVAICGESGSGKTTLLYLLGLLSSQKNADYIWCGEKIDLDDDRRISNIRRNSFAFLFQDNSLIDTLSIADNILLQADLVGISLNDADIYMLLTKVGLHAEQKEKYPSQLSGGEQQRAALAAILAKKPQCIFADEPTSSLDEKNTLLTLDILKQLSSEGISVVLATHNSQVKNIADCIYQIEDGKIVSKQVSEASINLKHENSERIRKPRKDFKQKYISRTKRNRGFLKSLVIVLSAIAMAGFVFAGNLLSELRNTQKSLLNQISDRQLIVRCPHQKNESIKIYDDSVLPLVQEDVDVLHNMEYVHAVYPYFEFYSFVIGNNSENSTPKTSVIVQQKTQRNEYQFDVTDNSDFYVVCPYIEENSIKNQLTHTADGAPDGVILTESLAQRLGINNLSAPVELQLSFGVPVRSIRAEVSSAGKTYDAVQTIYELTNLTTKVAGILRSDYYDGFVDNSEFAIYCPISLMIDIQQNTAERFDETEYLNSDDDKSVMNWSPNTYLVYVDEYSHLDLLKRRIENMRGSIEVISHYQDTEAMESIIQQVEHTSLFILVLLSSVIFVLMSATYIGMISSRKREFALLLAAGYSKRDLTSQVCWESLMHGLRTFIFALLIAITGLLVISHIAIDKPFHLQSSSVVYLALMAFSFIIVPSLLSVISVVRLQPDRILRDP